jgi:Baseplate J-like protein
MPIPSPNLDDRTFAQLVEAARQRITARCPEWTDLSVSDPGMALVEVFAYLTETMIYRLNRVPAKAYVEFLRLLGVNLLPPEAAGVTLQFKLAKPLSKPVEIPRGTRVTVSRQSGGGEAPVFIVTQTVSIPVGQTEVTALSRHCELVEAELVGKGTGLGGLSVNVSRPPIVAAIPDVLDLVVGVEAQPEELDERTPAREFGGKSYRVWPEVENFTLLTPDSLAYVVDRTTGVITFAPSVRMRDENGSLKEAAAVLAAVPGVGREIRAWYQRGGGVAGNVAANTLTVLKDPIPGVSVSNPSAATGGRSAETVENALLRGPQELHSLQRAVTARDFELLANRSGAVCRARAFTKSALWSYAAPGTVEILLVPRVSDQERTSITVDQLRALQTDDSRKQIQKALDERRPLGTTCIVNWTRYQTVKVHARVVAHAEEDPLALKQRVLERLHNTINPLPTKSYSGWRFGQTLRTSNVYDAALAEPGVSYVDNVSFIVEQVPASEIQCVAADAFQPGTWYAGSQSVLYRSMDDGEGWASAGQFSGQEVRTAQSHPSVPGLIAVATRNAGGADGSQVYVSWDCGENWEQRAATGFNVEDMSWVLREGAPWLFLATSVGLFVLSMQADASPVQVYVRPDDQKIGYYAVAASIAKGSVSVAVAARNKGGVFLSSDGGAGNTFRNIGQAGEDVRVLAVQYDGFRSFLWAGVAAPVLGDPGKGCFSWELLGAQDPPDGWQKFDKNWIGGSCVELAFQGSRILAATFDAGVLWLEKRSDQESWNAPDVGCGLPQASREHPFERINTLAADPKRNVILTGGKSGVYRSSDGGKHYASCSRTTFDDKVTLPPNWLFCSGEHEIEVVTENEKGTG